MGGVAATGRVRVSFDTANSPLARDLARSEAKRADLSGGNVEGPEQAQAAEEVTAQWNGADVPARRGMLVRALGGDRMVINRTAKNGRRVFNPERVHLAS
jgi:site-specific DNA recombinase